MSHSVDSRMPTKPQYSDHDREQLEGWLDAYCGRDGTERVLTGKILDFIAASNEQANSLIDDIAKLQAACRQWKEQFDAKDVALQQARLSLTAAGWQPAATAPKDGTRFQAWLTNSAGFGFWDADCRYNQKTGAFESYGRVDYDQDGWEVWCDGFTHWMPQPGEPK